MSNGAGSGCVQLWKLWKARWMCADTESMEGTAGRDREAAHKHGLALPTADCDRPPNLTPDDM